MSYDNLATAIWEWCISRNIWLSVTQIPGSENPQADRDSREFNESTYWSSSQGVLNVIKDRWGP